MTDGDLEFGSLPSWKINIRRHLAEIDRLSLTRVRRVLAGPQGPQVMLNGQLLTNFSSNDYLGLASDPRIISSLQKAASFYGVGAGASHLVCGHSSAHHELEAELAAFTGRDRALLFSNGYMANMGVLSALSSRKATIYEDRLNHASLIDGAMISGARLSRYAHADPESLQILMGKEVQAGSLIVSDGVFSMDGDLAPVRKLKDLADFHGAVFMVDDAHGLGVLGKTGGGVLQLEGLNQEDAPILMGTLGKAFGTYGAFVAGSDELIEYLIQRARTYIFTTAIPSALAVATIDSLRLTVEETWRREKLLALVNRFRAGAKQLGLKLMDSCTPIQPVRIGNNESSLKVSQELLKAGFLVPAIRPPTVPKGTARLRITVSALHEEHDIDALLDSLSACAVSLGDETDLSGGEGE